MDIFVNKVNFVLYCVVGLQITVYFFRVIAESVRYFFNLYNGSGAVYYFLDIRFTIFELFHMNHDVTDLAIGAADCASNILVIVHQLFDWLKFGNTILVQVYVPEVIIYFIGAMLVVAIEVVNEFS